MAKIIAFTIFKGGTGKTTSAVNTAAALVELGKRVLLVDLDQQASSTRYLGIDPDQVNPTLYHVFRQQTPARVVIQHTPFNVDVLPSSSLMAAIEESLEPGDEILLRNILEPLQDTYDYILIDTPPGKAGLAFNGIVAADLLIIPASAERMAIDGVSDLMNHLQAIIWHKYRDELNNQDIRILFTMFRHGNKHSPGIVQATRKIYKGNVLDIVIPETVEFPRSYDRKTPITVLAPRHQGSKSYRDVAKWIIQYADTTT
jgi:chromosome partitioning protein